MAAWKKNHNNYEVWHEITYPFPNFNGTAVEVSEWTINSSHNLLDMWSHAGIQVNPC